MSKERISVLLGDIVELRSGKGIKTHGNGSYPVYGANGVIGYTDVPLFEHSIIIGRVGAYCGAIRFEEGKFWASDNTIVVNLVNKNIDIEYLSYLLVTIDLNRLAGGSAQPLLTQGVINSIEVDLPEFSTQKRVARILGNIDKMIINNAQRIEILEQIAQLIYREWFVHYRFPGHEDVEMVDSELGLIPEGWELVEFGRLCDYKIGGGWGEEDKIDSKNLTPAYVIRGTDIPNLRKGIAEGVPHRFHKQANLEKRVLKHGDIVIEASGGSKGQPVGRSLLITEHLIDSFDDNVMCASFCKLFRPNFHLSPYLISLWLNEVYDSGEITKYQAQSTGITNLHFEYMLSEAKLLVPPKEIQSAFEKIAGPISCKIVILGRVNQKLARIRDLLLPKLISGELHVSDLDFEIPEEVIS